MKKLIMALSMVFVLAACNGTIVDEARSDDSETVASDEEDAAVVEAEEESAIEEEESDVEEAAQNEEDGWIAYEDMEQPSIQYIKDISPNDMAQEIEKNPYDYPVVNEEDQENYVQRFDLDGDGNEEEIKILMDGTYSGQYPSYILAIYDYMGNPKYAEYQYNAESLEDPLPILTVAELTGDDFLEIVLDSRGGYGFMEGNGNQSLGRLVYGFDVDSGNFRQLPVLGSYYDIYWQEEIAVQIDERISGLSEVHDFRQQMGDEWIDGLMEYDHFKDYDTWVGQRIVGEPRRVYPEKAMKLNESDGQFNLRTLDVIHEMSDLSLMSTSMYQWNEAFGWFEMVGSDFSPSDDEPLSFKKALYDPSDFNARFGTNEAEFEDYLGSWQMVVDGKLQTRFLEIEEDVIYETERDLKDHEQAIEREIKIDDYLYKEETGQLIPLGELQPFLDQPYNKSYQNLFTLLKIEDEVMLMDQYGHLYVEEDKGAREAEEDGWVYSAEIDASNMKEEEQTAPIETSIDVFSQEFMNEYFAGPEPFTFEGIEEGMSQTEVENLLGLPQEYYAVEGAEFAIYDNLAILYSHSFAVREGAFEEIDPDENLVTRTEVFLAVPHEEMVAAYGEPTLSYDEYPNYGPGADQTIYDHTRGNGYAIYIEVGMSGTAWLMTKGEESDLVDEYK